MTFQRKISCLIALLLHVPLIHGLEVGQTPHVAVVGGGWGGIGAVKSLLKNGCKVTLIDIVDPTGKIPYRTPSNKPFEPGTRGFWKDYPNIEELLRTVGLNEKCVFTPFTNSSFYSPYGLECTAPVFSDSNFPELPSPFGQIFASAQYFERLPLQDRASMAGLLLAVLDFNRNPEIFSAYDRMTAHELFIRFGISKRLVDDFLRPTLLVGLFKPPEELSAAVTLELLYFYALAHQTSFDVRWIKKGTIAEEIVQPVFNYLFKEYGGEKLTIYSGCQVESLFLDSNDNVSKLILLKRSSNTKFEIEGVDGCVLAVGSKGMKAIISGSKELALQCPELSKAASLGAIDVISIRIWMDCYLSSRSPVNVLSRFEELRGAGGTFFFLDQLQKENEQELWGTESPKGSVLACDFYNAGSLQVLSDDALVSLLVKTLLPSAVPEISKANVLDYFVQRYPQAVSWFSPGSFALRPPLQTSVSNLVCAGDWVRMGKYEHGAKGLCQERAYVSGLQAGNILAEKLQAKGQAHSVIPIREDEIQVRLGRQINSWVANKLPKIFQSPWVR